jgi:hypothetical protein
VRQITDIKLIQTRISAVSGALENDQPRYNTSRCCSSRYRQGIVASRFEEKKIFLESKFLSNVTFQVVDFLLHKPTEPEHLQWSLVLLPANACGSKNVLSRAASPQTELVFLVQEASEHAAAPNF